MLIRQAKVINIPDRVRNPHSLPGMAVDNVFCFYPKRPLRYALFCLCINRTPKEKESLTTKTKKHFIFAVLGRLNFLLVLVLFVNQSVHYCSFGPMRSTVTVISSRSCFPRLTAAESIASANSLSLFGTDADKSSRSHGASSGTPCAPSEVIIM